MTDSEQFKAAYDYLESLEKWVWHDFLQVPQNCYQKVFDIIDKGGITNGVRATWCETHDNLFLLSIPGETNVGKPYEPVSSSEKSN